MDITAALLQHADYFASVARRGDWTEDRLREWLTSHGLHFERDHRTDRIQFDLKPCPFCEQQEGNPAVWLVDGVPVFKCHREKAGCAAKSFRDLEQLFKRPPLATISAAELVARHCEPRQDVVKGLIRRGDVVNLIGGPKSRKSFLVSQLAMCVANGAPFLGRESVKGRTLIIDNELRTDDLARRLKAMSAASGLGVDGIDILPLRGKLVDLHGIQRALPELGERYSLVLLDALYKAMPRGTDENSNSDVTSVYCALDEMAERTGAATVVIHHTSKGSQAGKGITDMGAGAGAQSRSVDVHLVLRDHEAEDTVVLAGVIRAQPPIDPVCLTFEYPLWRVAEDKDPTRVAIVNKRPPVTLDQFVSTIPAEPARKSQVLADSRAKLKLTKPELELLLSAAESKGLVETVVQTNPTKPHLLKRIQL